MERNYTITKTPKGEKVLWCCNWIKGGFEVHYNGKILKVYKTKKEALEYIEDMKKFDEIAFDTGINVGNKCSI